MRQHPSTEITAPIIRKGKSARFLGSRLNLTELIEEGYLHIGPGDSFVNGKPININHSIITPSAALAMLKTLPSTTGENAREPTRFDGTLLIQHAGEGFWGPVPLEMRNIPMRLQHAFFPTDGELASDPKLPDFHLSAFIETLKIPELSPRENQENIRFDIMCLEMLKTAKNPEDIIREMKTFIHDGVIYNVGAYNKRLLANGKICPRDFFLRTAMNALEPKIIAEEQKTIKSTHANYKRENKTTETTILTIDFETAAGPLTAYVTIENSNNGNTLSFHTDKNPNKIMISTAKETKGHNPAFTVDEAKNIIITQIKKSITPRQIFEKAIAMHGDSPEINEIRHGNNPATKKIIDLGIKTAAIEIGPCTSRGTAPDASAPKKLMAT